MAKREGSPKIAIAGNPNSGKTTLFNALTGSRQRVGNWPGVTVEKKSGDARLGDASVEFVDLPGIYSLTTHSEDERVARDYLLSGEADLVVNVVDASNLERNLFLTLSLLEMGMPTLVALNMADLAGKKGVSVDCAALSRALGAPVVSMSATEKKDVEAFKVACRSALDSAAHPSLTVPYPAAIERALASLLPVLSGDAVPPGAEPRWVGLKLLERDAAVGARSRPLGVGVVDGIEATIGTVERELGESPDAAIASAKYDFIARVTASCVSRAKPRKSFGDAVDSVALNRFLGIPVFALVMYLMFSLVMNVGGAFIDFFDILFGAVLVDGFGLFLASLGSPDWLVALLAGGVGAGIQTVSTFVPIMFMMFLTLSFLEDSGYMARAAFVMDRALRAIGLPGKAFIPMIVGFGCSVPAIMATRTLESKRDRYLTVFMAPFMSCGARLPVYALFGAAFFGRNSGLVVMSLYFVGIALAVGTGFLLKNTLFKGEPAPFVMELPPYHLPRLANILRGTWNRLKAFLVRAGKVIVLVVALLGILNSIGTDGSFGNEDTDKSALAAAGRAITPVFEPMGLTERNWPATVGMFTGLFAKEAVVGTLNGLYGQLEAMEATEAVAEGVKDAAVTDGDSLGDDASSPAAPDGVSVPESDGEGEWSLAASATEALASIPAAFAGFAGSLADPLGLSVVSGDEASIAEEIGSDEGIFATMREYFAGDVHAAYAYLLFILIYFPCVAALGAIMRELGRFFGWVCIAYLTVLAWITATLYYQITAARDPVWIVVPVALLAGIVALFAVLRRFVKVP